MPEPLNVMSHEFVTIKRQGEDEVGDVRLQRSYKLDASQGARGRNSDNTLIQKRLGWAPGISLEEGIGKTYQWIYEQMVASAKYRPARATAYRCS